MAISTKGDFWENYMCCSEVAFIFEKYRFFRAGMLSYNIEEDDYSLCRAIMRLAEIEKGLS